MLTLQVQRPTRCRQHHQARRRREQRGDNLGATMHLLQVVQHKQGPALTQVQHHRGRLIPVHGQVAGDGLPHHVGVADGGQGAEVDPLREVLAK